MKEFAAAVVFGLVVGVLSVGLVAALERAGELPAETPIGCAAIRATEIDRLTRACDAARRSELETVVSLAWCRALALRYYCPGVAP